MRTLNILANHEMLSLQPNDAFADSSAATPALRLICPGLLGIDANGRLKSALAKNWFTSEDARTFRFVLHEGTKFSNGATVTAEAVAQSIRRSLLRQRNSLHAVDLGRIEDIAFNGDSELVITTNEPFPKLPWYLAWRHYVVADTEIQPTGAGPYILKEWRRGKRVVLERNEFYSLGPRPHFGQVNIDFAPSSEARLNMARSLKYDFIESVPERLRDVEEFNESFNVIPVSSGSRTVLAFNTRSSLLNSKESRRKVVDGIDLMELQGRVFDAAIRKQENEGVAAADHSVDPPVRPLKLVAPRIWPVDRVVDELQRQLAAVNIPIVTRLYSDPPWWPLIYPSLSEPDWDLAVQSMPARPTEEIQLRREYRSDAPFNATGNRSSHLDSVIDSLQSATDAYQRKRLTAQAFEIATAELMYHELYRSHYSVAIRKGIHGAQGHSMGFWEIDKFQE